MWAFLAFTYFKSLGEALPSDTLSNSGQSLPAKKLSFLPCSRRVSPIQTASFHLQSGDGECLPATQLYLSVFSCLTVSIDLPSDAGESLPASNLTFSTPRPARLTHPDREYFPPVGCRREPPDHTTYFSVFTYPTQRVLISRWMPARASRPDKRTFQTCCSTRLTRPTQRFWNHSQTSTRASGIGCPKLFLSAKPIGPTRPTKGYCALVGGFMGPLGQIPPSVFWLAGADGQ